MEKDPSKMTVTNLRDELEKRGLRHSGKKADLVARLTEARDEEEAVLNEMKSSKRQKVVDKSSPTPGKLIAFAGNVTQFPSTEDAEAAAKKAGFQVVSWGDCAYVSRGGGKFYDVRYGVHEGKTLDIVVLGDACENPRMFMPGQGQGTETWKEDQFKAAAKTAAIKARNLPMITYPNGTVEVDHRKVARLRREEEFRQREEERAAKKARGEDSSDDDW